MADIIGNLDDLIAAIEGAARGDADKKLKDSEARAEEILDSARQEADETRQQILGRAKAKAEQERRQQLAEATQSAKRQYLQEREELLNRVWQQAEERLRRLPEDETAYTKVLGRLVRLAVQTLGPGQLELAADPKGHELLTEERLDEWREQAVDAAESSVSFERASQPIESWGGLVATEAGSRRRMDGTFSTRLELAKEEIRETIFNHLVTSDE